MSGENLEMLDQVQEEVQQEQGEDTSRVETLAMSLGWRPKEEYSGENEDWVNAEQFILRSRDIQDGMAKRIKSQTKDIRSLKAGIESLQQHNERVYKTEISRLKTQLAELEAQKDEAIDEGDREKVKSLDRQMKDIEKIVESPAEYTTQQAVQEDPEFEEWMEANTWYTTNSEMAAYAEQQAQLPQYAGLPGTKLRAIVTKQVKQMFPEYFGNGNKGGKAEAEAAVPSVEGASGKKVGGKKKYTRHDLNQDQLAVLRQFTQLGVMNEEQYIADLVKLGELK
jgi:hypothetical protein